MADKWELMDATPMHDQSWLRLRVLDGDRIVAEINVPETELDQAVSDVWKIIAAPDLLQACEAFMRDWYRPVSPDEQSVLRGRVLGLMEDAVKKARVNDG